MLNLTGRAVTRRVVFLAAAVGATEEYLGQRKVIVEETGLGLVNFLRNPEGYSSLADKVAGGVRRELEIIRKVDKKELVKGTATRVAKKIAGI